MTKIIIKPAKENSKTRRYRKRGELMARRRAEDAELAKKLNKAWAKLTHVDLPIWPRAVYRGSYCLPEVARYLAGHRKNPPPTESREVSASA